MNSLGVIGGGVAGLTVAFRRAARGDRVIVLEASNRFGGQLHSERTDGYVVEHGAEGFVAGSRAVAELAAALGIAGSLIDQRVTDSCRFDGQALVRLRPGEAGKLLGFQVDPRALGRGIQSFTSGMSQLSDALCARSQARVELRQGCEVVQVARDAGRWQIVDRAGVAVRVDRVVLCTSAASAARLLSEPFGAEAARLKSSRVLDNVSVSLGFARDLVAHPLDATGFVVAEEATQEGFRACTFASAKLAGRAPADRALLRLFFRPSKADAALADAAWVARAERCAARALELRGRAERAWVSRWDAALPVFDDAHRERVRNLELALANSGVSLAGAAFHGSGIDGAVRSAEAAALALD